jgi:ABC-type transport system involved in multi-copper enzyme maturation permease subunit
VRPEIRVARDELLTRRRSLLALAGGTFVFVIAIAGTYTAFAGPHGFASTLGTKTPSVFSAFAGASGVDIFRADNYLAFGFTHPLFLVLTLAVGISMGSAAVAADVESGRAEILYVRAIPRTVIFDARVGAWVLAQVGVVVIGAAGLSLGSLLSPDLGAVSGGIYPRLVLQYLPLTAVFGAAAFAASTRAQTRGHATGVAVGAAALAYLVNFVALLWFPFRWARHLTPFGYYAPVHAVRSVDWFDALVLLAVTAALIAYGRWSLRRRDLV